MKELNIKSNLLFSIVLIFFICSCDFRNCSGKCTNLSGCSISYDPDLYPQETYFDMVEFRYRNSFFYFKNRDGQESNRISEKSYDEEFFELIPYSSDSFPKSEILQPKIKRLGQNRKYHNNSDYTEHSKYPQNIDLIWVSLKYLARPRTKKQLSHKDAIFDKYINPHKDYVVEVVLFTNPCLQGSGITKVVYSL